MDIQTKTSLIRRVLDEAKRRKLFAPTSAYRKIFSEIIHTVILEAYIEGYRDNHRDSGSKKDTARDRFWKDMDSRKELR